MAFTNVFPTINPLFRRPVVVVEQAMGESRTTIYKKIKSGLFTKPVSIGGQRVAWPANEVQTIINARIAGKSEDEIKKLVCELELKRGRHVEILKTADKKIPIESGNFR